MEHGGRWEGVPGVWDDGRLGGWSGGLYRYPTRPVPRTHISHILALRPYPRPNEGYFMVSDEVSQIGSQIDLNMTSE